MTNLTDDLMKQLRFIAMAANAFNHRKKPKNSGQQRVLMILENEDGMIQSQLAEILDLRPSSLAELLKKMENNGDITRIADEQDKRLKRVYLTESGRQKAAVNKDQKNTNESFFAGLSEEEQQQFSDYLNKIPEGWDEKFNREANRFVDPTDRLKAMQAQREAFNEHFGKDIEELTPEEMRKWRKAMKKEMHHGNFWGGRDFRDDPRAQRAFFERFFDGNRRGPWPNDPQQKYEEPDHDSEDWTDF